MTTTTSLRVTQPNLTSSPFIPASSLDSPHIDLLHLLRTHGFIVIQSSLALHQLASLRTHAHASLALALAGKWPHLRTLPKQFPPWTSNPADGIWGIQHLLHPDMPGRDAFAEVYFGDEVIRPMKAILQVGHDSGGDERLVMELFNMLVTPPQDFQLRWHRDGIPFDGVSREDEARLMGLGDAADGRGERATHAQYNLALYDDSSLHVIPGSHLRSRTEVEERLLAGDMYAERLPEMLEVRLQAGDIAFYDSNIIHRGVYKAGTERLTLHGSVGEVSAGSEGSRARQVLQHGVREWVEKCSFDGFDYERLRRRAEGMRKRLVKLGAEGGKANEEFVHRD